VKKFRVTYTDNFYGVQRSRLVEAKDCQHSIDVAAGDLYRNAKEPNGRFTFLSTQEAV